MNTIKVKRAVGDYLYDDRETPYFDLTSGFGTVFLGHCHPEIVAVANQQMQNAWAIARFDSVVRERAYAAIQKLLPKGLELSCVNSTGMESSEYCARYAAAKTDNRRFIGFSKCMHGKSVLTANITWSNALIKSENTRILEFPTTETEQIVLTELEECLKTGTFAGCFVEPIRGSFDGSAMSSDFMKKVIQLCQQYDCISIFDETLTGLYRTGSAFVVSTLQVAPDLLIFSKSLGNGFPISCVASDNNKDTMSKCLTGSTFSDNPIALAIASKVVDILNNTPINQMLQQIEITVQEYVPRFSNCNIRTNGKGALWVLNFESEHAVNLASNALFKERILCSRFGNNLRLLPKLLGDIEPLKQACDIIIHSS